MSVTFHMTARNKRAGILAMKRFVFALATIAVVTPAFAQFDTSPVPSEDQKVFIFGGRMGESDMAGMLNPFTAEYEEAIVLGGGYQHFLIEPIEDLKFGLEAGAAVRTGEETTGEVWGGVVGRYDGFVVGDTLRISPSLTFGASAVTGTMGTEAEREAIDGLPGDFLFYLSPEISFSTVENPSSEVFWRLHHRSGAWNTFGGGGSANATTIGIRTSF